MPELFDCFKFRILLIDFVQLIPFTGFGIVESELEQKFGLFFFKLNNFVLRRVNNIRDLLRAKAFRIDF
jgi:hypothetical protein